MTRLGNLKDILSGKKQQEISAEPEIVSEVSEIPAQVAETIKPISPEQLSSAIEKLAVHLESQDKKSAAATLRQNGHFLKNGIAYIELMKHEMVMFGELKQEVLQFLRSATEHPYLQIEFEMVLKARKEAKPFRSKDKLDAMIKNNPLLKDFMDTFNLELED